jgi:hypothetical protein
VTSTSTDPTSATADVRFRSIMAEVVKSMGRLCLPLLQLFLAVCLSACIPRSRLNTNCEWTHDRAFQLDLQQGADQRHLNSDVELAEELGIRYGDSFRKRDGRVEEHRRTTECTTTLFAQIAHIHGVTSDDVLKARGRRPATTDLTVLLSFAMLYGLVSSGLVGRTFSHFPVDEPAAALAAIAVVSTMVSASGLMSFILWADAVEIVRVGNGHMSYRVGRLPWGQHWVDLFAAGVIVFWMIAAFRYFSITHQREVRSA